MLLYLENPKDSTEMLLETIDLISNVVSYIVNMQKSMVFLSTNNEREEKDIKKTIPFTIVPQNIKYLGVN